MERFVRGDTVVVPFPFSDQRGSKRRPALVIASVSPDDVLLCQIASQPCGDPRAIPIGPEDLISGALHRESRARPGRLLNIAQNRIHYRIGRIHEAKLESVIEAIIRVLRG